MRICTQLVGASRSSRPFRIAKEHAFETLIAVNFVGTPGIVCRRQLFERAGAFDDSLQNSDDIDWVFRVTQVTDLGYIPSVLWLRRLHGSSISSRREALACRIRVYERLWTRRLTLGAASSLRGHLSEAYLALEYRAVCRDHFPEALRNYVKAWRLRKCDVRIHHAFCGLSWRRLRRRAAAPRDPEGTNSRRGTLGNGGEDCTCSGAMS